MSHFIETIVILPMSKPGIGNGSNCHLREPWTRRRWWGRHRGWLAAHCAFLVVEMPKLLLNCNSLNQLRFHLVVSLPVSKTFESYPVSGDSCPKIFTWPSEPSSSGFHILTHLGLLRAPPPTRPGCESSPISSACAQHSSSSQPCSTPPFCHCSRL